jgi:release factor glutamine methyltransferase
LKVGDALRALDAREARILLANATGFSEASIVASPDRELTQEIEQAFAGFVARRAAGEPIAYIVGHKEFYGIDLLVNPAVLIPRPETELLVELALREGFSTLLDLGTGSGAIAIALKRQRPKARVVAVEASAAALTVAQRNAARLGLGVDFRHGEWFGPLAGERFDIVVGNPPYVAEGDPHLEALRYEPAGALVSGADGLTAIRQIVARAPEHLAPGGGLFIEHGLGQDEAVRQVFLAAGLETVASWPDLSGIPRVAGGRVK